MKEYYYKAKKSPLETVEGTIKAESEENALVKLAEHGLHPFLLKEKKTKKSYLSKLFAPKKISTNLLAYFTRSISDLIESGVNIYDSISTVDAQIKDPLLKSIIDEIKKDLKDGNSFSYALKKHEQYFSPLFTSLAKAGESSGTLEKSCARIADYFERKAYLKSNIIRSLAYPFFLIAVGTASIIIIFTFVIPKLIPVFIEMNVELPLITKIVLKIGNIFRDYWRLMGLILAAFLLIFEKFSKTKKGKIFIQKNVLKIPYLKNIFLKKDFAECFYTTGTLIQNGIPPYEALQITTETTTNIILKNELYNILTEFKKGKNISDLMQKTNLFFPEIINIIKVGEKTGNLSTPFLKLSSKYEKEVEKTVNTFITFIEPVLILIFGSILGAIAIAMLLPIFKLSLTVK